MKRKTTGNYKGTERTGLFLVPLLTQFSPQDPNRIPSRVLSPRPESRCRLARFYPGKEFQTSLGRAEMLPQTSDKNAGRLHGGGGGGAPADGMLSQSRGTSGMKFQADGIASGHLGVGAGLGERCWLWGSLQGLSQHLSSAGMSPRSCFLPPAPRHGAGHPPTRSSSKAHAFQPPTRRLPATPHIPASQAPGRAEAEAAPWQCRPGRRISVPQG